ncbi:MAG: DEAD/DEAH box helicase family protein [Bacteroidetes bacterium]|nr:DEAD/DEAH box helicase family protein [Bacteroidota bacterium]
MKLHFDANQTYQKDAISSVVKLFEGQPLNKGDFEISGNGGALTLSELGFGNNISLTEYEILKNLNQVQSENEINLSGQLERFSFRDINGDGKEKPVETAFPNFTIEMETGTGKTYVYLRTIYELNKVYGFSKFVIVVPSIAIREGVLKSLQITEDHLQNLYNRTPINYYVYDSRRLPQLKNFATSNAIQILIINIDSFTKDTNIINQYRDSTNGKRPIEYVQATNPIVILDEPQNMETDARKKGITNLNPLFVLRYSATHKYIYNLIYKLDPVKAYDLGLVKQIEVDSVYSENDFNDAFIQLENISSAKTKITAKIKIDVNTGGGVKRKSIKIDSKHYDLYELSGKRDQYKDLLVNGINYEEQFIELSNGKILKAGETTGDFRNEIMKIQIQKAVEEHFIKEKQLGEKGIKALSLFFIDRVANYRSYDESGNIIQGKFATWFEESFERFQKKYPRLIKYDKEKVHNGYFAQDRSGHYKDSSSGESKDDDDAYHLIMKDKERLLDANEPLRFIFSHSALREGWDNTNVFQICTLNETGSVMKKRQEIGRGLRLCVNKDGYRVFDKNINRLTVIANESYETFARTLQKEIEDDCGIQFTGRVKDKRDRVSIKLKKNYELDQRFLDLWDKIKYNTRYRVNYSTEELIKSAVKAIKKMPEVTVPVIRSIKTGVDIVKEGVGGHQINFNSYRINDYNSVVPDVAGFIQSRTELTRSTIIKILRESGRLNDVIKNPQLFLDMAVKEIKDVLTDLMIEGIKYERMGETEYYKMELFADKDLEGYKEYLYKVRKEDKTLYNYIPWESEVERKFAEDCETNENIEFYIKLPNWFVINTPIGTYNPDWALIYKNDEKIYFVAETKYSLDPMKRYSYENYKIKCGEKHFEEFEDVKYQDVRKLNELKV